MSDLKSLVSLYLETSHIPHPIIRGANTAFNEFSYTKTESKLMAIEAIGLICTHSVQVKKLNRSNLAKYARLHTTEAQFKQLQYQSAYLVQIEIGLSNDTYHFQGISTRKCYAILLAYVVAIAGMIKLNHPDSPPKLRTSPHPTPAD